MSAAIAELFANFHVLRPLALLLLLALPLFWLVWHNSRTDAGAWRAVVDAHLLPHLIERVDAGPGRSGIILAAALWALACIVLAGPVWEREPMPLYRNQSARVLALELAPSMLAQDEKPNRLTRARFKINDILSRSRDYQTALIGYGEDAFVAAPLTDDVETVRNLVDSLDPSTMPVAGNATARAIATASALIEQAGLHRGEIILIADSVSDDAAAAARRAHARGFTVSVLGVGTATGAPVPLAQGDFEKDANGNVVMARFDEAGLRAVASAGGGRYAHLTADARDLDALLAADSSDIGDHGRSNAPSETAQDARWRDRGPWLLLLLLPLALCGFRRGWLMVLAIAIALAAPIPQAQAASLADLWQRPDQQAATALADGDAKHALDVAHSPQWRASAAYRAGDYAAAVDDYAKLHGADDAYNKGNALAKLGRYEDAIKAYDDALKAAPQMADAQANRQAVEDFLAQQKAQNKQQDKNSSSSDKKQSNSQGDSKEQQSKSEQGSQGQPEDKSEQGKQDPSQQSQKDQQASGQKQGDQQADAQKDASSSSGNAQEKAQGGEKKESDKESQGQQESKGSDDADQHDQAAPAQVQKPDATQQKALSNSIDKALAEPPKPGEQSKGDKSQQGAVVTQDEATREKQQTLEQWLQRVPDDPGGLLRRKFQLEYQRRHQGAGEGG
ncbi:MAG: VWA domain-containing protein [Dokdonella sp.]